MSENSGRQAAGERLVGVTVLPEYLQSEGVERVLDNLIKRANVTAVATSPYVMVEADEQTGSREPPIDAGAGGVRLLDRPLWGKRKLCVKTSPSFVPDRKLYEGLRYQPSDADELTHSEGGLIKQFIASAHERGLQAFFQVQSAIPPGYRVQFGGPIEDDIPLLPDGRVPTRRVANNGSLASPHIVAYQHALIRDLLSHYADIDGIRFDWPEYPPYLLDSVFLDFSEHAHLAAGRLGFNFDAMRQDALRLYQFLHGGLTNEYLERWLDADGGRYQLARLATDYPGWFELLRFKATLSEELLTGFRRVMNEAGGEQVELAPSAFPPPWSLVSGMDYSRAAKVCDAVSVKLYGMHWAMILRFYGDQLCEANPHVDSNVLVKVLVRLLGIADDDGFPSLQDYRYPEPDEPHLIGHAAQIAKIRTARQDAGVLPIHVLAHGYGPVSDFRDRIQVACEASPHGFWINRYGYLSDAKLDAVGEVLSDVSPV